MIRHHGSTLQCVNKYGGLGACGASNTVTEHVFDTALTTQSLCAILFSSQPHQNLQCYAVLSIVQLCLMVTYSGLSRLTSAKQMHLYGKVQHTTTDRSCANINDVKGVLVQTQVQGTQMLTSITIRSCLAKATVYKPTFNSRLAGN